MSDDEKDLADAMAFYIASLANKAATRASGMSARAKPGTTARSLNLSALNICVSRRGLSHDCIFQAACGEDDMSDTPKILTAALLKEAASKASHAVREGSRFSEWIRCPNCRGTGRARGTIINFGPLRGWTVQSACGHCNNGYVRETAHGDT